jgi:hypothetical protein
MEFHLTYFFQISKHTYFLQIRESETAERTIETSSKPAENCLTVSLVTSEKNLKIFTCTAGA